MTRFNNVETVSLLNTAKLFLQKTLESGEISDFKMVPADEETMRLVENTYALAGGLQEKEHQNIVETQTFNCLKNIFNVFSGVEAMQVETCYDSQKITASRMNFPKPYTEMQDTKCELKGLATELLIKLREKSSAEITSNQLLRLLELYLSYVPDGIIDGKASDIPLYDRAKLAAAFSACLSQYLIKQDKRCADINGLIEKPALLMVSGDISGIQQFIYTIPSKGALKSLRGRSFYLEILLENIVDEILTACGVSRSCLLYTGGGHFYLLVPNTENTVATLNAYKQKINTWFLSHFGTLLFIAMGWTTCTIGDLTSNKTGDIYRKVGQAVACDKLCRYDEGNLERLFSPESEFNKNRNGARECSICHMSNVNLKPYNTEDESEACPVCRNLFLLGQAVISEETAFIVSKNQSKDALPIPGIQEDYYLKTISSVPAELQRNKPLAVRIYVKNTVYLECLDVIYLWISDYAYRDVNKKVLEFSELAALAGGEREETGIERLAVLRADVDNLGAAFISGFPEAYASLTRTSVLSRYLSLFFKRYVNLICKGNMDGVPGDCNTPFSLFGIPKSESRRVHVVYSGGDDLFIVGVWDDLIELAVDIRRAFSGFTNNKLSFSAGIGFFQDKCPVSQMARKTGELEDFAKGIAGKDGVALFGVESEVQKNSSEGIQKFKWKAFIDKVCSEKLTFLLKNIDMGEDHVSSTKLKIGKTALYKLLLLMEDNTDQRSNINIARFAYTLARMEPDERSASQEAYKELRRNFYEWYKNESERKQLSTALQLLIYRLREKGEQSNG